MNNLPSNAFISAGILTSITGRYGKALFDLAHNHQNKNMIEVCGRHLDEICEFIQSDESAKNAFYSDSLTKKEKIIVAEKICNFLKAPDFFTAFLCKLIENNRIVQINDINIIYKRLSNLKEGTQRVEVSSVVNLDNDQKKRLANMLEKHFKTKVNITYSLDSKLLGGLKVRFGSHIVDMSLLAQINNLLSDLKGPE